MDVSFYTAVVGAKAQQNRLDSISNNMANLQTDGYKAQSTGFLDLLYSNMGEVPPKGGDLTVGGGTRAEKTDLNFEPGSLNMTGGDFDYAILGDGYFAQYNMKSDQVTYTRSGNFHMSQMGANTFYLAAQNGDFVLDQNMELIPVTSKEEELPIGIFDFQNKEGVLLQGNNVFLPVEKNGPPVLQAEASLKKGYIEGSNVDLAYEMARVIETQRAYQLSLRMIQTADEVEQTINGLR